MINPLVRVDVSERGFSYLQDEAFFWVQEHIAQYVTALRKRATLPADFRYLTRCGSLDDLLVLLFSNDNEELRHLAEALEGQKSEATLKGVLAEGELPVSMIFAQEHNAQMDLGKYRKHLGANKVIAISKDD